ncbi:hypothetical protein STRIP9103_00495, partial [Streptomyces ipomoeae 91-03]
FVEHRGVRPRTD